MGLLQMFGEEEGSAIHLRAQVTRILEFLSFMLIVVLLQSGHTEEYTRAMFTHVLYRTVVLTTHVVSSGTLGEQTMELC